jgi:CRP-like cAMP-binding protein
MAADWLITALVGRDIVQLLRHDAGEFEVGQNVFQPGEIIAERRRPVRHVHIVVDGEVELVRDPGGRETVYRLIGPGGYFGRKLLELEEVDFARARTVVRTLALRADQANALQDVLAGADRIVARTGIFSTLDEEAVRALREERSS